MGYPGNKGGCWGLREAGSPACCWERGMGTETASHVLGTWSSQGGLSARQMEKQPALPSQLPGACGQQGVPKPFLPRALYISAWKGRILLECLSLCDPDHRQAAGPACTGSWTERSQKGHGTDACGFPSYFWREKEALKKGSELEKTRKYFQTVAALLMA